VSITAQGPRTLYDLIWDDHLIDKQSDGTCLIYIDRHLVDEVDSPQAFAALRLAGLRVHAPDKTLLVVDHNVPTSDRRNPNPDPESAAQIAYLAENAKMFGLEYYDQFDKRQGICHVVGPEQGFTLPGLTLVCGDSHTSWRIRCARLWHRHVGDGACVCHSDADPVQIEEYARGC
jgi:3-isopropylmalate/(R)-2-methylmalate dehydratase large subunit